MEVDLSDDVSALSMDGASAIAGNVFAKRMRKDFAKMQEMQLGIPEDEDEEQQQGGGSGRSRRADNNNTGDELIEPFPKTYEEWKEKKKEKKHKHKKHHKKGHKSSGSKSSRQKKEKTDQLGQSMDHIIGESSSTPPPPIMEISIQATDFQESASAAGAGGNSSLPSTPSRIRMKRDSAGDGNCSDARSYPSACSTSDSTSQHSRSKSSQNQQQRQHHRGSGSLTNGSASHGATAALRSSQLQEHHHRSSFRSHDPYGGLRSSNRTLDHIYNDDEMGESMTHMTGTSRHSRGSTQPSHVTAEDIDQLRTNVQKARKEEKQVRDIHARLEKEVRLAGTKSEKAEFLRDSIVDELERAEEEREELQYRLKKMEEENKRLRRKVRHMEEEEDDRNLDDVLESMGSKIKQMKLNQLKKKRGSDTT